MERVKKREAILLMEACLCNTAPKASLLFSLVMVSLPASVRRWVVGICAWHNYASNGLMTTLWVHYPVHGHRNANHCFDIMTYILTNHCFSSQPFLEHMEFH